MMQHDSSRGSNSNLTRLCVGRDEDRPARHLAWAGSVCAMFLVAGFAGIGWPHIHSTKPKLREQIIPVVFTAPAPAPAPRITSATPPTPAPEISSPAPHVASVANISGPVALAVPLGGLLVAAPVTPQEIAAAAPGFTRFDAGTGTNNMPQPAYPELARRRGYKGKATLNITIGASGEVLKVELAKSSGFKELDDAAIDVVRDQWRFGPGGPHHYFLEINFQLK